jgi:hypothetical protein
MATSKSGGSTQNNRDSQSKRLGVMMGTVSMVARLLCASEVHEFMLVQMLEKVVMTPFLPNLLVW